MKQFGIIGYPLGHSFSKAYFEAKFEREKLTDCQFNNYEIEHLVEIPKDIFGLSVTIPHKQSVIPLLKSIDPIARQIGAVNCIDRNGRGYNTDVTGFEQSLLRLIGNDRPPALVLGGTGGAAQAVIYVLKKLGLDYATASRSKPCVKNIALGGTSYTSEILESDGHRITNCGINLKSCQLTYDDLTSDIIAHHRLIINTTPLGMYPQIDSMPRIPYQAIGSGHYLFDLVYNPDQTAFMQQGIARGAAVSNGLEMLHLQAEAAWTIWNGQ